jgi:hypothetical protein
MGDACHHDPANPRHTAKPGHPRSISVREDHLLEVIRQFFAQRIFGPDRAALLAASLPATAADVQASHDRQAAAPHQPRSWNAGAPEVGGPSA